MLSTWCKLIVKIQNKQELNQNRDTNARNKNKLDDRTKRSNNNNNNVKFENASSEMFDNKTSILNPLNDMPSALTEVVTRSKYRREK